MARRAWIVGIVVLIVVAVGVGLLISSYLSAPLRQTTGRTCIGCVSWHWNGTSNIRASRLSGDYAFRRDTSYLVSFSEGSVSLAGESLDPGCHEGRASEGDALEIGDARDVRLRVPAPDEGCPADGDAGD